MRILRRHWAIALVLSVILHAFVAWSMTSRPETVEVERAAGAPVAVSAVSLATAFESETKELEPTEVSEPLDAVRPESVEPQRQTAKLTAAYPERTVATERTGPKLARVASPDAVALPVTRETAPRSTARPETLTRSQPDAVGQSDTAVLKAETAARPVRIVSPRVEPTAPPNRSRQTAALRLKVEEPFAQSNKTATRIEAVASELAESAIPLAKPQRQAALTPKAAPQPKQTRTQRPSERRAQQAPKRAEKKKQAPERKTASRGGAGQTGSTTRGRRAEQAGDGGRRRGVSGKADMSNYLGKVVSRLQRQKRYPSDARRKRIEGTAVVAFVISPNGSVGGIRLRKSAGNPALDKAALAMVRRAAPFPPFPKNSGRNRMPISVPVRFAVR